MDTSSPHLNGSRRGDAWQLVAVLALIVAAVLAAAAAVASLSPAAGSAPAERLTVHATRGGVLLGIEALSGRVTLVGSSAGLRWRIAGVTGWRRASGRVLVRDWDTAAVRDGAYRLELGDGAVTTRTLTIRNWTPLTETEVANASAGLDPHPSDARAVVAASRRRSYRPGETAELVVWGRYADLRVQVLHVGPERVQTVGNDTINGVPVGRELRVAGSPRVVRVPVGSWPSGLYAARLTSGSRVGFAPFVVRPRRLGEHAVAVVQPTNTWQAYNYRSTDGDARPDTWYYSAKIPSVDVSRPYLDRGVPPHFRQYDLGFLHWLARERKGVDMLAQEDLERLSGDRLARLYRLIVFPGHHEYVTTAEYDAIVRYRDLGGNLAFLSANNFFSRVDRRGDRLVRIGRWRDLGRPEAALVGVQYFDWNHGNHPSRQYVATGVHHAPWLFARTDIRNGKRFGWWGIEVDGRTPASPRSIRMLATLPNAFGTGRPAEMTYYETPRGARVFAAGAFTLGGAQAQRWTGRTLLRNLWSRLAADGAAPAALVKGR